MKDPGLPRHLFKGDNLLNSRRLAGPGSWRGLGQAHRQGAEIWGPAPLRLRLPAPSMAGVNCLVLEAQNLGEEPLLAGLYLFFATAGSPPLAFSGGRALLPPGSQTTLLFTRQDFGIYGEAGSWEQANTLDLVLAREKGAGPGQARVRLGWLQGQTRCAPRGPRLAAHALNCLLRPAPLPASPASGPEHPGLRLPPPHQYPRSNADDLLAGRVLGRPIGFPWDWSADPHGAMEWRHFLHRHHDLRALALAWARDHGKGHLKALRHLLTSWIREHPVPVGSNGGAGPAWETLSAAWRLLEWGRIKGLAWPDLGRRLQTLMLRSVWEHARHLSHHQGHANNWRIIEAAALALAGMTWPEFSEAAGWRRAGLRRLAGQCRRQFSPDGTHRELSPHYQALCLEAVLLARQACLAGGWPWPRATQTALARGLGHLAALARPDFTWPALNDSGGAQSDYTALFAWAGRELDRPEWLWLGSRGQEGKPPHQGSRSLDQAGLVVLRENPLGAGLWLLLRAAAPGLSHAHRDALSMEVHAGGPRVVDPGISSYAPGPMSAMYRGAAAHSQPLLDGQGVALSEAAASFRRWPGLQLAMAQGRTPGGAELCRWVVLVRGGYGLIWDRVWGLEGVHAWQVGWLLFPGPWRRRAEAMEAPDRFSLRLLQGPAGARLDLARGRLRPARGWVSLDGVDKPAPHWRLRARGTLPMQALWLLAPRSGFEVLELNAGWKEVHLTLREASGRISCLRLEPMCDPPLTLVSLGRTWPKNCP